MKPIAKLRLVDRVPEDVAFKVLVIEDDADYAINIVEALELGGIEVVAARTGADGVRIAKQHCPQAVLLDLGLPDGHGYDVARALRNECLPPDAAIVVLTGSAIHDLTPSDTAGIDLLLNKPVDAELLGGLLRHVHLQRKRKHSLS